MKQIKCHTITGINFSDSDSDVYFLPKYVYKYSTTPMSHLGGFFAVYFTTLSSYHINNLSLECGSSNNYFIIVLPKLILIHIGVETVSSTHDTQNHFSVGRKIHQQSWKVSQKLKTL